MNQGSMKIDIMRKVLASTAAILGIAHLIVGILVYEKFDLEMIWFLSAGIAIIVAALANFRNDKTWILKVQNALMLGFIVALLTLAPQPQVWLGLVLFTGLLGLSYAET